MYKNNFSSYLKTGVLAAVIIAVIANVLFIVSSLLFGHEIGFIGQDRDTLYIVFITFATVMALLIGTVLFYFLQKYTKNPVVWFGIIVLLGFLYNTYMAEVDLDRDFKATAHLIHVIVSGLAIYLVPKLSKK
ncbi:DUF6069 family protein [Evansella cellulosilytica]|uniref:Uncharacterized protein n=1 Tax=Evansella cellulosilytica (strain ATCC 21833 / DSM 2522 / FERM P-1141 / JCM 9156 / N-4) TaxID=649639 RepID=E6TVV7_EVAC2|nr:DUF6069 family protein [Evansella cellulosilytica]ADU28666.1 hypothetical protein Bcell_0384 [Evansella cellulosilytica DSM 2522]